MRSVSCGAPSSCLAITRRIFFSSSIRSSFVCRRPAVSTMTTSAPCSRAAADRVERHRARVALRRARDDLAARALRPHLELLDRGGAERVGGAEHDLQALGLREVPGELADRRRLAGAVDADDHDHGRACAQLDRVGSASGRACSASSCDQRAPAAPAGPHGPARRLVLEPLDDLRGRARTDVGHDQRLLEALPGLVVERVEQRRLDLGAERRARLAEVLAQAGEHPAPALRLLGSGSAGILPRPAGRSPTRSSRKTSDQSRGMRMRDDSAVTRTPGSPLERPLSSAPSPPTGRRHAS